MPDDSKFHELKDTSYEIFIVGISILAILNVFIILITPIDQMDEVLRIVNIAISVLFLADFFYRLLSASSKRGYLINNWGWLDFLGSLPFTGAQLLHLSRAIRILRLMKEYGRSALSKDLKHNRAGSALASASLLVILVLQFGSFFIIGIESRSPLANIVNPIDALWWSVVTIATVGYGDQYPVTVQGRLIGTIIIISGVFLFTVFTGFLAKIFFSSPEESDKSSLNLQALQNTLEEQNSAIAALQEQLNRIEKQISQN